jgi:hypothetical protein
VAVVQWIPSHISWQHYKCIVLWGDDDALWQRKPHHVAFGLRILSLLHGSAYTAIHSNTYLMVAVALLPALHQLNLQTV